MAYAHVAHDCLIGDQVIMANCATLAGHIEIEDYAILGGLAVVHQFVRIGAHALVSGNTGVVMDIPPYTTASGSRAKLFGLNLVGLKRRGISEETIRGLKKAYKIIFRSNISLEEAVAKVEQEVDDSPELRHLLDFIGRSKRGLTR
jgi:UDP-N-acetylglucosamine acyltransferase